MRPWKPMAQGAIRRIAAMLSLVLPLSIRQALVANRKWTRLPGGFEVSMGLLDDLRRHNPDALHRFLWSNHLAYAMSYEIAQRFQTRDLNSSRRILFENITGHLRSRGLDPRRKIGSVFEVGCSLGYLLRHLEVDVFPSASILHGLDIDSYAVETGTSHLQSLQSRVRLFSADMAATERVMGNQIYDVVICCGVLMYVNEETARHVVRTMLQHARHLVGLICLAQTSLHPPRGRSATRASDGAFVHDVESMIQQAGGKVVSSTWIGSSITGSSPANVIVAEGMGASSDIA